MYFFFKLDNICRSHLSNLFASTLKLKKKDDPYITLSGVLGIYTLERRQSCRENSHNSFSVKLLQS